MVARARATFPFPPLPLPSFRFSFHPLSPFKSTKICKSAVHKPIYINHYIRERGWGREGEGKRERNERTNAHLPRRSLLEAPETPDFLSFFLSSHVREDETSSVSRIPVLGYVTSLPPSPSPPASRKCRIRSRQRANAITAALLPSPPPSLLLAPARGK